MLGKNGYHRFVRIVGDADIELEADKIKAVEAWNRLRGVVTSRRGMSATELFNQFHQLWQVEESFRITEHDMRARPIFHWAERRIGAQLPEFASFRDNSWQLSALAASTDHFRRL
ncbi:MAG: hypothetical protein OXE94_05825, partial [Aestuariivita sp.]|nr:hypothetical protein [Aestuariivita sp.]MCY4203652.1 hypothetical protein [Aestuariivita sp.]